MLIDLITYTPMYVTGFWAVLLLMSSGKGNKAKQFLGIFMVLAFGVYFSHALFFQNHYLIYQYFDPVYIFSSLSVYPMYYWYIRILSVESDVNFKSLWYFFPSLVLATSSAIIYALMGTDEAQHYVRSYLYHAEKMNHESTTFLIQKIIFILSRAIFTIQIFYFLIYGRKLVIQYNSRIANFYSNIEQKNIGWVNLLLYSFFATSVLSIIFNLIGRSFFLNSIFLLLIPSAAFSILLFLIGYLGYMQNYTVTDLNKDESEPSEMTLKEYNRAQLKEKLLILFKEQKIFRQQDLKITQVSDLLQTNRTYVSNLINSEFGCAFSDFVNQYRIAEACELLKDSKQQNYSLNFVSEASGFGSVNSFIRIFKEIVGTTPGKYRDKLFLN
jgi:AraC-like DNA-binding protein